MPWINAPTICFWGDDAKGRSRLNVSAADRGTDPELSTDLLLGPIYHRFFLSDSPMDAKFGTRLADLLAPALMATAD